MVVYFIITPKHLMIDNLRENQGHKYPYDQI